MRLKKDNATRESFDLKKKVELALIAKRDANLEIHALASMAANKATESAMARPPPPPPVEKAKTPNSLSPFYAGGSDQNGAAFFFYAAPEILIQKSHSRASYPPLNAYDPTIVHPCADPLR